MKAIAVVMLTLDHVNGLYDEEKTTERTPVIPAEVIPHRYTDEPTDDALDHKRLSRAVSIDVLPHDRLTLTWTNINAYAVPDTGKCWHRCCPPDSASDGKPYHKQILFNGSFQIALYTLTGLASLSFETRGQWAKQGGESPLLPSPHSAPPMA